MRSLADHRRRVGSALLERDILPNTLLRFGIGLTAISAWVWVELTDLQPLLALRIFKIRMFTLSAIVNFIVTLGMFGGMLLLPLFLQNLRGLGAAETGVTAGAKVSVSTSRGEIRLPVEIAAMPDRVVWLPTNSAGCSVRRDLGAGHGTPVTVRSAE